MAEQITETSSLDNAAENTAPVPGEVNPRVVDYAILLKPRVMSLVLFTGIVGIVMAPGTIDWLTALIAIACIGVGAGASGAINISFGSASNSDDGRLYPLGVARSSDACLPADGFFRRFAD